MYRTVQYSNTNKENSMTDNHNNDNILDLIRSSLEVHSVTLFLSMEDGNYMLVSASTDKEPYTEEVIIPLGKGFVGWILRHQQPLTLNSFDQRQGYLGYYTDTDESLITSFMGCPLPGGGALCVDSITHQKFTEKNQQVLQRFARLVARHIHSAGTANNNEKLRRYYKGIEQLIELHNQHNWGTYLSLFLNIIKTVTDSDYTAFVSSAEDSLSYTVEGESTPVIFSNNNTTSEFSLSNGGLIGWVFRNEVPVHAEGTEGSSTPLFGKLSYVPIFQSIMCIPVIIDKVTCGVLCLASLTAKPLPQDMRIFAKMAALILAQYLDILAIRYRLNRLLPHATIHRSGAFFYDPDTAPLHHTEEE